MVKKVSDSKNIKEALGSMARCAVKAPSGRASVKRLIKAMSRGGLTGMASMLEEIIDPPKPARRRGPHPMKMLLEGTSLTDAEKLTLKSIRYLWDQREKMESPKGVAILPKVDGGGMRDPVALRQFENEKEELIYWEVFRPWLKDMKETAIFSRKGFYPGSVGTSFYDVLHSLMDHGIGLRVLERQLGCRNGSLIGELKYALQCYSARYTCADDKALLSPRYRAKKRRGDNILTSGHD